MIRCTITANSGIDAMSVDDVFIAGSFRVCPRDVTTHLGSHFMQAARLGSTVSAVQADALVCMHAPQFDVVGMPLSTGSLETNLGPCPPAVLVWKAVAMVLEACRSDGTSVEIRRVDRIRVLQPVVMGEPLTSVATVRTHGTAGTSGLGAADGSFATLDVELRRRGGGRCLAFELKLESKPGAYAPGDDRNVQDVVADRVNQLVQLELAAPAARALRLV